MGKKKIWEKQKKTKRLLKRKNMGKMKKNKNIIEKKKYGIWEIGNKLFEISVDFGIWAKKKYGKNKKKTNRLLKRKNMGKRKNNNWEVSFPIYIFLV